MTSTPPAPSLVYSLLVTPTPLLASPPGAASAIASLQVVATNPGATSVTVNSIVVTVTVGGTGTSSDALTNSANVLGNTYASSLAAGSWQLTPPGSVSAGSSDYTLQSVASTGVPMNSDDWAVIQLYSIPVNSVVGTTTITVTETSNGVECAPVSFPVSKFPFGFTFTGLMAMSAGQPVAQVAYNDAVQLVWNSSLASPSSFSILQSSTTGQLAAVQPTSVGTWTSPQLTTDTVFTVTATVQGPGNQQLSYTLSTVVAVAQPDLEVNQLTVQGGAQFNGSVQIFSGPQLLTSVTSPPAGFQYSESSNNTSPTDGYLFVCLSGPQTNADFSVAITLTVTYQSVSASTGSIGFSTPAVLLPLPIQANASTWSLSIQWTFNGVPSNQLPSVDIYFMGLGSGVPPLAPFTQTS